VRSAERVNSNLYVPKEASALGAREQHVQVSYTWTPSVGEPQNVWSRTTERRTLITHCALGGVQEATNDHPEGMLMAESVYKVIELVGTSTESWEKAAAAAIKRASKTLRDLRVAEVSELDLQLKDGDVETYRAKVKVSFKYEDE
jgi:flavin-binding protein dodecin